MENIRLIGTSHIAKQSIKIIKKQVETFKPDIIAVELDKRRYYGLTAKITKQKVSFYNLSKVGFKGFLFAMIGSWVAGKLGRMVGVEPGEDMRTAINIAKTNNLTIALIDQDIEITLSKFSKYLTWKERFRFIADIFNGIFFQKREMKKYGFDKFDLTKVPSEIMIKKMIGVLQLRYPSIYNVLVHERNVFMANKLKQLHLNNPGKKILAVVGAGHIEGMNDLLFRPVFEYNYSFDVNNHNSNNTIYYLE